MRSLVATHPIRRDDLTRTGDLVGTLRYMAPERFQGRCDARSDVYSLGLTLYELVALKPAFAAPDRQRLIHQITQSEPPPVRRLAPTVPRDLETIIQTAIAHDPADRYPTAGQLADDLRRWLGHEPIRARRATLAQRARKWLRRHPSAVVAGILFFGVAALVWVLLPFFDPAAEGRRRRFVVGATLFVLAYMSVLTVYGLVK